MSGAIARVRNIHTPIVEPNPCGDRRNSSVHLALGNSKKRGDEWDGEQR